MCHLHPLLPFILPSWSHTRKVVPGQPHSTPIKRLWFRRMGRVRSLVALSTMSFIRILHLQMICQGNIVIWPAIAVPCDPIYLTISEPFTVMIRRMVLFGWGDDSLLDAPRGVHSNFPPGMSWFDIQYVRRARVFEEKKACQFLVWPRVMTLQLNENREVGLVTPHSARVLARLFTYVREWCH